MVSNTKGLVLVLVLNLGSIAEVLANEYGAVVLQVAVIRNT